MKHMNSAEKISMQASERSTIIHIYQFENHCAKSKDLQQNWSKEEALSTPTLKKQASLQLHPS